MRRLGDDLEPEGAICGVLLVLPDRAPDRILKRLEAVDHG